MLTSQLRRSVLGASVPLRILVALTLVVQPALIRASTDNQTGNNGTAGTNGTDGSPPTAGTTGGDGSPATATASANTDTSNIAGATGGTGGTGGNGGNSTGFSTGTGQDGAARGQWR